MRRFFDRPDTRWRDLRGALHFYALPPADGPLLAAHARVGAALRSLPGLAVQPAGHVHMTLQRLDAYLPEIDADVWADAERALGATVADCARFRVAFAAPAPRGEAVEAVGEPNGDWLHLVGSIREALTSAGLADLLTPAPYGPHYTCAYCVADTDDADVVRVLAGVGVPTEFVVGTVALVAVDQHPDEGVFTFETLRTWSLG